MFYQLHFPALSQNSRLNGKKSRLFKCHNIVDHYAGIAWKCFVSKIDLFHLSNVHGHSSLYHICAIQVPLLTLHLMHISINQQYSWQYIRPYTEVQAACYINVTQ